MSPNHPARTSRSWLPRIVIGGVLLLALTGSLPAAQPNFILLMGDDHGWDETGYNGHPHLRTPVLDEMARQGLRLNRFYAAHPSCSPTRGSVITGRHPNRYGTFAPNWSIRPQEVTIAHVLSKAGYACGHFGKWHLGPVKADSPTNPGAMGFQQWLSHDNFFELDPVLSRDGRPPRRIKGESSAVVIDEAIRFIRQAKENQQPFLTVIWFGSPHEPYSGLAEDLALYADLPAEYGQQSVKLTSNKTGRQTTRPLKEVLQERYAEITAMDRAIGRLREWLDEQQLREDTMIWYCGDNGSPSGASVTSPFRGRKGTMFEGGIRVPGLIEWPRHIQRPTSCDVPCVTSDILPTLCELTNQPLPERPLDGIGLAKILNGSQRNRTKPICFWSFATRGLTEEFKRPWIEPDLQTGTTPLVKMMAGRFTRNFTNYHHPRITDRDFGGQRVILDHPFKLIVTGLDVKRERQLFDLAADPAEKQDLASDRPSLVADLEAKLHQWQRSVLESLTGADYR